ncbi:ATPase [Kosmotoga arenicorallina S304]|uniref:ATPase n=1 Tax=Kosmotoga arenicorallina S304 TaxID=1453497 RepID=A0A182C7P2_9BACT|nr:ATP-binding protein [Kosmotoga arenicorallina]OAA31658.1 ATPase [Kosmotoga arenicorallina S304]
MFVNRDSELQLLENEYNANRSSFVVMYGRRRIGKTTLLKEFIKGKNAIYFLATEENEEQNLKYFQNLAYEKTRKNILRPENTVSWEDIFDLLTQGKERQIIVIDEYPYLTIDNKGFSSKLQRIWDEILNERNVMLVLCGSMVNMMYSETLSYSSPLYGRRTAQIRLKQMDFEYLKAFFPDKSKTELIELYSITGGVPKYIELFNNDKNLHENIKDNILAKGCFLYEEPVFLLSKEFRETGTYFSILKSISEGNHKLGNIASRLNIKQTSLSYYLKVLIDMDLIKREVPITEKYPEKSKKGLYMIKDNFILFWFKFVYPYRSHLELDDTSYVMDKITNGLIDNHISFVYEDLCRNLIRKKAMMGEFGGNIAKVGKWWDGTNEIDIVGVNRDGEAVLFGECKYQNRPTGLITLLELEEKSSRLRNKEKLLVLFSKCGFTDELIEYSSNKENIILFKLLDIISGV